VRQGDNVTMSCTVTGVTMLDVVRLTHDVTDDVTLTHDVTDDDNSTTSRPPSLIADNDLVKEAFSALGRYRVLYHAVNATATLQLRIRGIRTRSRAPACHSVSLPTSSCSGSRNTRNCGGGRRNMSHGIADKFITLKTYNSRASRKTLRMSHRVTKHVIRSTLLFSLLCVPPERPR